MAATLHTLKRQFIPDEQPDSSFLEQEGWEDRLLAFTRGDFSFVGIRAVAEIRIPYGHGWITQTIESPGLWGIEDDSGETYFESVYVEELGQLQDMLEELGVQDPEGLMADEIKRTEWYANDCPPVQA